MRRVVRLGIAQINCTVGDLSGNCAKIADGLRKAEAAGADIVSFPELSITGYPPEDLLLKSNFIEDNLAALKKIVEAVGDIVAVVGFVDKVGKDIYNAASVIYKGRIKGIYHKMLLPNYGVFDEKRYFKAGTSSPVFRYGELRFGVTICEDIWQGKGPVKSEALAGADLIIIINASPYYAGKIKQRGEVIRRQAKDNKVFVSYANLVGGQDELVFDGQSMILDNRGRVIGRAGAFKEDFLFVDMDLTVKKGRTPAKAILVSDKVSVKKKGVLRKKEFNALEPNAEIYQALLLGLKDYVNKNGFRKVVVGLSGGIDSALVAVLATDSLGKKNVVGVFMPTSYSSTESESDAKKLAANLGIKFITIPIESIFRVYLKSLKVEFSGLATDITEENLQARIRGNVLMALSNKFGWLVLTTGNKSEMSTGYATLYGDMAGGFAIIKDVPKMLVYKLAEYRNSIGKVIPEAVFTKEPTAELKPGQKDSDTLPPYKTLDRILKAYIEEDKGLDEILAMGFDKKTVSEALNMVDRSEYKRRQAPPGIKITPKAFGKDRRMPITNRYEIRRSILSGTR